MSADQGQTLMGTAGEAFLLAFPSLFSIINPVGAAFIFDGIVGSASRAERASIAGRVGANSMFVMFGALWLGASILNFFGVSLNALRIAGGLVVAASGWNLLTTGDHRAERSREGKEDGERPADLSRMAFFPLTLPLTTGPGTISVAITLGATRPSYGAGLAAFFMGVSLAAAANAALIWAADRFSDRVAALTGESGRQVIARLSAFLLICIGVQILVTALGDEIAQWRLL